MTGSDLSPAFDGNIMKLYKLQQFEDAFKSWYNSKSRRAKKRKKSNLLNLIKLSSKQSKVVFFEMFNTSIKSLKSGNQKSDILFDMWR